MFLLSIDDAAPILPIDAPFGAPIKAWLITLVADPINAYVVPAQDTEEL